MGSGSEAEDENAGAGIAEAGDGACPIGLILIGSTFGLPNPFAVAAKAYAALAVDDGLLDAEQNRRESFGPSGSH
jgi:hypothetical protein